MGIEIIFAFSSSNHAIHAEHVLLKAGLKVQVMPLPSAIRAGCGLCLRTPVSESKTAKHLLAECNIYPQQVYTRITENGKSSFAIGEVENNES